MVKIENFLSVISNRLSKISIYQIIALSVSLSFLLKLILFATHPYGYWFDEIVATEISKYPVWRILEIIAYEPKPPGFYLLLKIFPVDNIALTRVALLIFSHLILLISLYVLRKSNLLKKTRINTGVALFLSTYTFFVVTGYVKVVIIAFPLALLTVISLVKFIVSRKTKDAIMFNVLLFLLLAFDYNAFAIVGFVAFVFYVRNPVFLKKHWIMITSSGIIFSIYFKLLLFRQILNVRARNIWAGFGVPSFFVSLKDSLGGYYSWHYFLDAVVFIFILAIGLSYFSYIRKKHPDIYTTIFTSCLLLIPIFYVSGLFVRPRFIYVFYLLLSILAGWGLQTLRKRISLIHLAVILGVWMLGMQAYLFEYHWRGIRNQTLAETVTEIAAGNPAKTYYYVDDHPIRNYVLQMHYFPDLKNIIPLNPTFATKETNIKEFTKEYFENDKVYDRDLETTLTSFQEFKVKNVIYEYTSGEAYYFDKKRINLNLFSNSCELVETKGDYRTFTMMVFEECNF